MCTEIPAEQLAAAVEQTAADLLLEADVYAPPVDALIVAERLELVVACVGVAQGRAQFMRVGPAGKGAILLADEPRIERRQWAVAHEIGESWAYRVFAELGVDLIDVADSAREHVANRLANSLLLPRDWLRDHGSAVAWDLFDLKAAFATASHELIARRMLEMPPPVIVTLFDQGQLQWRRSNVRSCSPMTPAEHDAWGIAFELNVASRCDRTALPVEFRDVRAWPVHETGWRREIVRTELHDL